MPKPDNKVFLVNKGFHQTYSKADRFGEIDTLTEGRVNIFSIDTVVKHMTDKLKDAKEHDYILVSGYAILNGIAMHYFLKNFGKAKLLIWEGNNDRYTVLTLVDF